MSNVNLATERRRADVATHYLKGIPHTEIARLLNLRQITVIQDLTAIRDRWMVSSLVDFDRARANELAKVDHLESTYWDAWERSRAETEETISEKSSLDGKTRIRAQAKKTQHVGEAAFLAGVQWCIEKRCKLLGLDAPTRHLHAGGASFREAAREMALARGLDPDLVVNEAEQYLAGLRG